MFRVFTVAAPMSAGSRVLRVSGGASTAAAGAGLALAGEMCLRWAVFRAGFQSAGDPRDTVEPQGARLRARQDGGATGLGDAPQG